MANSLRGEATGLLVDYVLMQLTNSCLGSPGEAEDNLDVLALLLAGPPEFPRPALAAFELMPEIAAIGLFALWTLEVAASVAQPVVKSTISADIRTGTYGPRVTAVLSAWQNDQPCQSPPSPPPQSPELAPPPPLSPCTAGGFQTCQETCPQPTYQEVRRLSFTP